MRKPPQRHGGAATARDDARAVSVTLDYTLTLAIATLVVTGLLVAGGDFVTDRREQVIRTELSVVGQHLASDLKAADRLAGAGTGADALVVNAPLPERVTGSTYTVSVAKGGPETVWLNLTTTTPDVTVSVRVANATEVETDSVSGGDVAFVFDPSAEKLEVET